MITVAALSFLWGVVFGMFIAAATHREWWET